MRKRLLCAVLLFTLLLSACGKENTPAITETTPTPSPTVSPTDTPAPTETPELKPERCAPFDTMPLSFTEEETQKMSSFMNMNRYLVRDGRLYGLFFREDGLSLFGYAEFAATETDGMSWGTTETLESDCQVDYLYQWSNRLYFRKTADGLTSLFTMHPAGGARETMYDGDCDFVQLRDGVMYFTDEVHRLCSLPVEGGDATVVMGDTAVYYPYLIAKDWLLYQNDEDGERLHLRCLSQGADVCLTGFAAYHPVISEHYLYCTSVMEDGQEHLARLDLEKLTIRQDGPGYMVVGNAWEFADGPCNSDFAIGNGVIYGCTGNSVSTEDWSALSEDDYSVCIQYISAEYVVRYDYSQAGTLSQAWLIDNATNVGKSLPVF